MEIILGKTAGFCYGVTRAVDGAKEETKNQKEIYCLGEIVHNQNVIEELQNQGIKFIDNIEEAKGKTIIRAHGVPKQVYDKAKELNIEIKDLTCPNVLKIHRIAEKYEKEGYFIILVGKENHPEVIGITSFCGENFALIKDENDIENLIKKLNNIEIDNVVIISQTTYNSKKFDEIASKIKEELNEKINLKIEKTICLATEIRQKETEEIAKKVDSMIIIGDKKSSNTNKLYNIACKFCTNVSFIQSASEINLEEFKNTKSVGIMAGASTPKTDIDGVMQILKYGGKDE